MSSYRYRFVGYEKLPSGLNAGDVELHCRLPDELVREIRNSGYAKRYHLGLAVQLSFLALTGRNADAALKMPGAMLSMLCEQLGIHSTAIASLKSLYSNADRTLSNHRAWVREKLLFSTYDPNAEERLKAALSQQAIDASSVDELLASAQEWLFDNRIVLPGQRVVHDLARSAFQIVENLALATIRAAVTPVRLRAVLKVMHEESPTPGISLLEWLKQSAGKHGVKGLKEVNSRIDALKTLGVHLWDLQGLSIGRIHAFAQAVVNRPPSETARRIEDTRSIEIVCFLKHLLGELSDEAIFRNNRHTSDFVHRAKKRVQAKQAQRAIEYRHSIESMRSIAADSGREAHERLAAIMALADDMLGRPLVSQAEVVRETLTEQSTQVRTILDGMGCLDLKGDPEHADSRLVLALQALRAAGAKELPVGFDTSLVEPKWRPFLDVPDRKAALRAFEGCALMRISKGLRGGSLYVNHSATYQNKASLLIPQDEWERDKVALCEAYGLELDPRKALDLQYELLRAGLADVEVGLEKGLLEIDEDGCVRIPAIRAAEEDPELRHTNQRLSDLIGATQLPDVILEIDSRTQISTMLLGRQPEDAEELIALYAGLLAHGTEIDAKAAAAMIPGVPVSRVSAAMRMLEAPGRLRSANDSVVAFQQRFPIVKLWSDGKKASSDMMALDATRHLSIARTDPRRKTAAAGIYTHILGSYPVIFDQPIVLLTRQDAPAVHGIEAYNSNSEDRIKVDLLAVDTHGYTYSGMSVAKLLKFDLCPQLAGLPDRKIWTPRLIKVSEALEQIAIPAITEKAIREGWDQTMRLIASIKSGRVSVAWALARHGSAAAGDDVRRCLDQYGRLLRSVFLCDYFTNDVFRREIHTLLNRGESVHLLQRAIYYGRITAERGRRRDELKSISGSHALLTNVVIGWNTMKLQETVDRLKSSGQRIDDSILRRIGPVHFGHINFRGTMSFSVARYASVLLKGEMTSKRTPAKRAEK
jgi:TnpA family transposase